MYKMISAIGKLMDWLGEQTSYPELNTHSQDVIVRK